MKLSKIRQIINFTQNIIFGTSLLLLLGFSNKDHCNVRQNFGNFCACEFSLNWLICKVWVLKNDAKCTLIRISLWHHCTFSFLRKLPKFIAKYLLRNMFRKRWDLHMLKKKDQSITRFNFLVTKGRFSIRELSVNIFYVLLRNQTGTNWMYSEYWPMEKTKNWPFCAMPGNSNLTFCFPVREKASSPNTITSSITSDKTEKAGMQFRAIPSLNF